MDAKHSTDFTNRLVAMAEIFDVKMSPQRQALYFEALRDLPFEDVVRAMNQSLQTAKFLPRPAELRSLVVGESEDVIEAAWLAMRTALGKVGSYASVTFADAALGESVLALFGSWPQACAAELTPEMWSSKRKEFGRVYRVFKGRNLDGVRYLPGLCERDNGGRSDWQKHVPLSLVGTAGEIKALPRAEQARQEIAAQASDFEQLRASLPAALRLVPKDKQETA